MLRARLRALGAKLFGRANTEQQWAPEPTRGLGSTALPTGVHLERSAFLPVAELARAVARPRITLQHHWCTWVGGAEGDVPLLLELHLAWAQYVDFIGVSWELTDGAGLTEAGLAVDAFHRDFGLTWRSLIVQGSRDAIRASLRLPSEILPQTWVRDATGAVLYIQEGALDDRAAAEIEAVIRAATGVAERPRLKGW